MDETRRRFVLASGSTGAALLAGCLGRPIGGSPGGNGGNGDDGNGGNGDPANGDGDDPCDPLELPLVDEPPHDPERPPQPEDGEEDEWNERYLGDGMDDAGGVPFDRINLRFRDSAVDVTEYDDESVFYATLLTSRDEFEEHVEPVGEESEDRADDIDFDEEAVIAVLSGFGSSSVRHEWVRVDEDCDELHVNGYYVQPYVQTADYTTRASGVVVDRSDEVDRAWVSLTVGEGTRVNFSTDDDVQVVDGDDEDDGKDGEGAVDRVQTVPATRDSPGDWRSEGSDEPGVVVQLADEADVREVTRDHEDVDRFVEGTDFDEDTVFYIESVGPDACYRTIDVTDVSAVANDDDEYFVYGIATAVDDADDGESCATVITYPGVLVRVESDVEMSSGEFSLTDGWGNERAVRSVPASEFSQE